MSETKIYWLGDEVPICDFCRNNKNMADEFYDALISIAPYPWARLCPVHFMEFGRNIGQHYRKDGDQWVKVRDLHK